MPTNKSIIITSLVDSASLLLDPDQNYVSRAVENQVRHTSLGGVDVVYTYNPYTNFSTLPLRVGEYKDIRYNIRYTPYSQAMLVNEWWLNQHRLSISEFEINGILELFTAHLINQTAPFTTSTKPYHDLWQGVLIISSALEHMGVPPGKLRALARHEGIEGLLERDGCEVSGSA